MLHIGYSTEGVLEKDQPPAMLSPMSWTVKREGSTLHVTITPPVHDWNPLLARLIEEVDVVGGVTAITLPTELPFTDARDKTTLNALWAIFMDQGISIHRTSPTGHVMGSPGGWDSGEAGRRS